jgi:hypothetical protein
VLAERAADLASAVAEHRRDPWSLAEELVEGLL